MRSWEALLSVSRRASAHLTLPASVVAALRADRDRPAFERHAIGARWQETGFVFTTTNGTPLNPRNVPRVWHGLLAAAGLPRRPIHVTRHIAVSLLIAECIPLKINQEVVGHPLLSTTADIYGHLFPQAFAEAADAMDRALG